MEDIKDNSQKHGVEDSLDQQIEDLEVREDADRVLAGTYGDPDEGGQAHGAVVRSRLAANCNETLVEDESS